MTRELDAMQKEVTLRGLPPSPDSGFYHRSGRLYEKNAPNEETRRRFRGSTFAGSGGDLGLVSRKSLCEERHSEQDRYQENHGGWLRNGCGYERKTGDIVESD
jgi:hypothetical protein